MLSLPCDDGKPCIKVIFYQVEKHLALITLIPQVGITMFMDIHEWVKVYLALLTRKHGLWICGRYLIGGWSIMTSGVIERLLLSIHKSLQLRKVKNTHDAMTSINTFWLLYSFIFNIFEGIPLLLRGIPSLLLLCTCCRSYNAVGTETQFSDISQFACDTHANKAGIRTY